MHINSSLSGRYINWLLGISMFFLPFKQGISILCWGVIGIFWIYEKGYFQLNKKFKELPLLIVIVGFYFLHVLGLLWSINTAYGLKDLETKMTFLLFPLIFSSLHITKSTYTFIRNGFVSGCIFVCIYCLVFAINTYLLNHDFRVFFYSDYSKFMHTTYFSMYINLAILMVIKALIEPNSLGKKLPGLFWISIICFLFFNILLLSSRTAIVITFITSSFAFIFFGIQHKLLVKSLSQLLIIFIFVGITYPSLLHLVNRFNQVEEEVDIESNQNSIQTMTADSLTLAHKPDWAFNSTNTRIAIWQYSFNVFIHNCFFGVGTGDIKEELNIEYKKHGFQYGIEHKLNPHNQYLHTGVILGIPGLLVLLAVLILPLQAAIRKKSWLFIGFLLIISLNAFTESILETQNGVLFFGFFYSIFYVKLNSKDQYS